MISVGCLWFTAWFNWHIYSEIIMLISYSRSISYNYIVSSYSYKIASYNLSYSDIYVHCWSSYSQNFFILYMALIICWKVLCSHHISRGINKHYIHACVVICMHACIHACILSFTPRSIMLKNLPNVLSGISWNLCLLYSSLSP